MLQMAGEVVVFELRRNEEDREQPER